MKSTLRFAASFLMFNCVISLAVAQTAAPVTITPPISPPVIAPSATLAQPSVVNLDSPDGNRPYHFTGELGVGLYSFHGIGGGSPLLGAGGSVGVFGERVGAGFSWFDASQSITKPGAWSVSHRP